jgi:hypothetical protein
MASSSVGARNPLRREYAEELGAELINIRYLCALGNILTFDGQPGHEMILFFKADIADETLYARDVLVAPEDDLRVPPT